MSDSPAIRLGIGILAHDEASTLPELAASLFRQSIFHGHRSSYAAIHIACIPNGCTDATAAVARDAIGQAANSLRNDRVTWSVEELETAGKARAWNHCIHHSLVAYDYICLIDADIVFAGDETIHSVLSRILEDPHVAVATDSPIKKLNDERVGLVGKISDVFSRAAPPSPTSICGQFYCARGPVLRSIWMPPGLPVEDGFLRAMVITHEFRQPEDPRRIVREEKAAHYFEPNRTLGELWRHKKRLMIGTALNSLLFTHLWQNSGTAGAGQLLREQLESDPAWLSKYFAKESNHSYWVVPMGHVLRRLHDLKGAPIRRQLKRTPLAIAATALDLLVAVSANREIRRNQGLGFW